MLPEFVDSHCHLDFPDFEGETSDLISRARAAGVTPIGRPRPLKEAS